MPFLLTAAFPCLDDFVLFGVLTVNYTIKIKRIQKKKEEKQSQTKCRGQDKEMGSVTKLNYGYNYA